MGANDLARAHRVGTVVDVVAQKKHQVRLFLRQVAIRTEITSLPMRARDKPQARRRHGIQGRRCARLPHRALRAEPFELIPVRPARLQPRHLHMHRVRPSLAGHDLTLAHHAGHRGIAGDPPTHRHRAAQPTMAIGGIEQRRQARPDHKTIRQRVPGSHAQGEWIVHPGTAGEWAEDRKGGCNGQPGEYPTPALINLAPHRRHSQSSRSVANTSMSSCTPFLRNAPRRQPSYCRPIFSMTRADALLRLKHWLPTR